MYTHFQMESNLATSEIGMPLERQKNFLKPATCFHNLMKGKKW